MAADPHTNLGLPRWRVAGETLVFCYGNDPVQLHVTICELSRNVASLVGGFLVPIQANQIFGVNSTLPPLCAAFAIASLTWSKP
jgi:hypothetical protein